jgi:hypothetical protein
MIAFINSDVSYPKKSRHPWITKLETLGAYALIKLSHLFGDRIFCQNQATMDLLARTDCIGRILSCIEGAARDRKETGLIAFS